MLCFVIFPLRSAFRSEAKRITQISNRSKQVYCSAPSRANTAGLADGLDCDSRTVECYGSKICPIAALEIM